jgi:hypothetical protein
MDGNLHVKVQVEERNDERAQNITNQLTSGVGVTICDNPKPSDADRTTDVRSRVFDYQGS